MILFLDLSAHITSDSNSKFHENLLGGSISTEVNKGKVSYKQYGTRKAEIAENARSNYVILTVKSHPVQRSHQLVYSSMILVIILCYLTRRLAHALVQKPEGSWRRLEQLRSSLTAQTPSASLQKPRLITNLATLSRATEVGASVLIIYEQPYVNKELRTKCM